MAEVTEGRRRTVELRLKLAPSIAEEFGAVAASRGLVPATLAAVVLGEYLEAHRHKLQVQRMVAVDMSKRMSDAFSGPDAIGKAIASAMQDPELLAVLAAPTGSTGAG